MSSTLTALQIPCCLCGTMIYPNGANQCTTCLSHHFNLQEYIQRPSASRTGNASSSSSTDPNNQIIVYQCRNCRRFQRTEKCWEDADHESSQLMSICLKQVPALQNNYHSTTSNIRIDGSSGNATSETIGPLKLIDTQWIWTEPHCMRYKIRCTIQTEIYNVRIQQRVIVLLHCMFKNCPDCTREYNHRTWQSIVQIRQKLSSSLDHHTTPSTANSHQQNGLMVLEMALSKNKDIRKHVIKMDRIVGSGSNTNTSTTTGYDFYFLSVPQGNVFVNFLQRIIPMRVRTSKKLVSSDPHSKNVAHMKHTTMCDIVPFSIYDLVMIHKSTKNCKLSGHLVLVTKLASVIHMIDAAPKVVWNKQTNTTSIDDTLYAMELSADTYYKQEKQYHILQSNHRLVRFVILDIQYIATTTSNTSKHDVHNNISIGNDSNGYIDSDELTVTSTTTTGRSKQQRQQQQYTMVEVIVARESDMGQNDDTYTTITHLGRHIEVGDIVLGYDLLSSTTIGSNFENENSIQSNFYHNFTMPDIVLVAKALSGVSSSIEATTKDDYRSSNKKGSTKKMIKNKSKAQQRGGRKNDGKRLRELEDRAKRMGFLPQEEVDDDIDNNDNIDGEIIDEDYDIDDIDNFHNNDNVHGEHSIYDDLNITDEVLMLERELEALSQKEQDVIIEESEYEVDDEYDEVDDTVDVDEET